MDGGTLTLLRAGLGEVRSVGEEEEEQRERTGETDEEGYRGGLKTTTGTRAGRGRSTRKSTQIYSVNLIVISEYNRYTK